MPSEHFHLYSIYFMLYKYISNWHHKLVHFCHLVTPKVTSLRFWVWVMVWFLSKNYCRLLTYIGLFTGQLIWKFFSDNMSGQWVTSNTTSQRFVSQSWHFCVFYCIFILNAISPVLQNQRCYLTHLNYTNTTQVVWWLIFLKLKDIVSGTTFYQCPWGSLACHLG